MFNLDAYFQRIGYAGSRAPTLATLRQLQSGHALAIPFENLDTLIGQPVHLDSDALQRKLVHGRRGGFCFEHNSLFALALTELGFVVTALAARVVWERPVDEVRARTHMLLHVRLAEGDFLTDVGFGGLTPTGPLRLEPLVEQPTPHEVFRVLRLERDFTVQARLRGEWKPLYRFDLQPQAPVDIELLNFYVIGHQDSPMRGRLMAARAAADRRYALRNGMFSVHHNSGAQEQRRLTGVTELRELLAGTFGIDVPPGVHIDGLLERLIV